MKHCRICERDLPPDQFHKNKSRADGLQSNCKDCQRARVKDHFTRNKDYYRAKTKARNREERRKIREIIGVEKAKVPTCPDCGMKRPPCAMQFDHVRGEKRFNVGEAPTRGVTIANLLEEIAKCEIVCAACHAERTEQRRTRSSVG